MELIEATRDDGTFVDHLYVGGIQCAVGVFALTSEIKNGHHPREVLNVERECKRFREWQPGFSPKEHREMEIVEEQRKYNRQMLEEERQWREQQAEAERNWREGDREARKIEAQGVEKRHQQDVQAADWRFWIGFLLALIVAIAGQLTALLVSHMLPPPSPTVIIQDQSREEAQPKELP